jgi:phosphatidylserine decarboxylase
VFLDPDVNRMLTTVLSEWGKFSTSLESAYVLGEHNERWFAENAQKDIIQVANAPLQTNFKF